MALGVARGMAALEENDPPIVHRDLKPTNVFIDAGEQLSYILTQSANVQLHHSLGNRHLLNSDCQKTPLLWRCHHQGLIWVNMVAGCTHVTQERRAMVSREWL